MIITPFATITRPSDTTSYNAGDLIANDTDAADVVPLKFGVSKMGGGTGKVVGARIFKNDNTATAADYNLHLFASAPVPTVGDNGQLNNSGALAVGTVETKLGVIALDMTTGGYSTAAGLVKDFALTAPIYFDLELTANAGRVIYGLLEADGGYAPSSGEVFKIWLHIENEA